MRYCIIASLHENPCSRSSKFCAPEEHHLRGKIHSTAKRANHDLGQADAKAESHHSELQSKA